MKKILVIRFSSIGDIVLTTPVIRCLKNTYPNAEIHFLTKAAFKAVLTANPHLEKVYAFESDLSEVINELQLEDYDFVVDLHKNIRSKRVVKVLKKPSENFPKLNYEKWLLTNFKVNKMPNIHIVDRYFEAVKPLKVSNDFQGLDFYIQPENKIVKPFDEYVVLVVGAAHKTKSITIDKTVEIINTIASNFVLIGGPGDQERANEVIQLVSNPSKVVSKCGVYNIEESASAIEQADFVITPDTGMMHIASAFNKHIISVWGNTVPDFGMYPYLPQSPENMHIVEVEGLKCRPCSKIGYDKCPKGHFKCIKDLDVRKIEAIVSQRAL